MKGIQTCQDEDCLYKIIIYRFSGGQGPFKIPEKWCRECDLLVALVERTIRQLGIEDKTKLEIKPWFFWFWEPLLKYFAWHPPILVVNGKVISQGIVPAKKELVKALA